MAYRLVLFPLLVRIPPCLAPPSGIVSDLTLKIPALSRLPYAPGTEGLPAANTRPPRPRRAAIANTCGPCPAHAAGGWESGPAFIYPRGVCARAAVPLHFLSRLPGSYFSFVYLCTVSRLNLSQYFSCSRCSCIWDTLVHNRCVIKRVITGGMDPGALQIASTDWASSPADELLQNVHICRPGTSGRLTCRTCVSTVIYAHHYLPVSRSDSLEELEIGHHLKPSGWD